MKSFAIGCFCRTQYITGEASDVERNLREQIPTSANTMELLQMMTDTRADRRLWIQLAKPAATTILKRYPRLVDMNEAVGVST